MVLSKRILCRFIIVFCILNPSSFFASLVPLKIIQQIRQTLEQLANCNSEVIQFMQNSADAFVALISNNPRTPMHIQAQLKKIASDAKTATIQAEASKLNPNQIIDWKEQLKPLEDKKKWDCAIELLQEIINENPNNRDAYLSMNYLLMNLLVEEDYDQTRHLYYAKLTKKYFEESYAKFLNNPEYLFYMGIVAHMSEWYFGIELEQAKEMLRRAAILGSPSDLYIWGCFAYLGISNEVNNSKAQIYAKKILINPKCVEQIRSKGSVGEYILEMITDSCARES